MIHQFQGVGMDITSGPVVEIDLAGAKIAIPSNTIAELWLEKLRGTDEALSPAILSAPRIGDRGEPDYRLIDLGEAPERMNWADAKKWAEGKGGSLPTRREQAVMFVNRAEGQYKKEWYWSCEQYAGDSASAWVRDFYDGDQSGARKSFNYRARAVRRLAI